MTILYVCLYCDHHMEANKYSRIYECEICSHKELKQYSLEQRNVFGYDEEESKKDWSFD